jgi:hypothetical protein
MPLWIILIGAAAIFLVWSLGPLLKHDRYRRTIRERGSVRAAWETMYPAAMPTVECVLSLLCDAFLFKRRYCFHFHPDDRLLDVYKGTTGPIADALQIERLTMDLRRTSGVDILTIVCENTVLREIVDTVLSGGGAEGQRSST